MFSPQVTSEKILPSWGDPVSWWELSRLPFVSGFFKKEHYNCLWGAPAGAGPVSWSPACLTQRSPFGASWGRGRQPSPAPGGCFGLSLSSPPFPSELCNQSTGYTHLPTLSSFFRQARGWSFLVSAFRTEFFTPKSHIEFYVAILPSDRHFTLYLAKSFQKGLATEFQGRSQNCHWINAWGCSALALVCGECTVHDAAFSLSPLRVSRARPSLRGLSAAGASRVHLGQADTGRAGATEGSELPKN